MASQSQTTATQAEQLERCVTHLSELARQWQQLSEDPHAFCQRIVCGGILEDVLRDYECWRDG